VTGLQALGVAAERIYVDHALTDTNRERAGLHQALAPCRAGDTLVVTRLDRLAQSLPDARAIADELTQRDVKLNLAGSVHDPTDPVERLLFNVRAMVADFESDLIRMRTRERMKGEGQRPPTRQAARAQPDAGSAARQALPRRRAHRQRAPRAIARHALDDLPRSRASRRTPRARAGGRPGNASRSSTSPCPW
jgi:DNA invertase Pin-like site-specific DNA recombinase